MIDPKAIELSLRTWYPKDHPLHLNPHHPLGKLLGEWGELLDDYMKHLYKPGREGDWFTSEAVDIWYYLRILCYQRCYEPEQFNWVTPDNIRPDSIIAHTIKELAAAFTAFISSNDYSVFALDVSYTALIILSELHNLTLDDLTALSWEKLKPGSERGEEWMKAHVK